MKWALILSGKAGAKALESGDFMRIFLNRQKGLLIRISGNMADVYNPYPMRDFCGINIFPRMRQKGCEKSFGRQPKTEDFPEKTEAESDGKK